MALECGFPSADQYLEAIDSDEWTEALAFYEIENCPEEPAPPSDESLSRRLIATFNGIARNRNGNSNR